MSLAAFAPVTAFTPRSAPASRSLSPRARPRPPLAALPRRRFPRASSAASAPPPLHPPDADDDVADKVAPAIAGRAALDGALQAPFGGDDPDALVVVMFHARWCRVCKTLGTKLPRVAADFPHVRWLRVDFAEAENKPVCNELGVKLLPTFRFYGGGAADEPLEEFTSGPFGVKRLRERLEPYRPGWRGAT